MKSAHPKFPIIIRRVVQGLSLALFLWLLWRTVSPLPGTILPVDSFLRMDPLVTLAVPLSAREWINSLLPGVIVILTAVIAGRFFCGYICPMGTTLDLAGALIRRKSARREKNREGKHATGDPLLRLRWCKYLILTFILGAALAGVNGTFWASPIPLITRFYALVLHPLLLLMGNEMLIIGRDVFEGHTLFGLEYLQIDSRRYYTLFFLLVFFGLLFILETVRPRFWCRYLCPVGALLALVSRWSLWKRKVHTCNSCGQCAHGCPSGAILPGMEQTTRHSECLTCLTCTSVCPQKGTIFTFKYRDSGFTSDDEGLVSDPDTSAVSPIPSRRAFLLSAGGGLVLAAVELFGTGSLLKADSGGTLLSPGCIRPPGALPEPDFLDRCVRCGQCMKVCPTNALHPTWFAAGVAGMFSPILVTRRGACMPECNACGNVCPTGALHALPLEEKNWAKVGGAVVKRDYCLAWAEDRRCVVCEEVCPFGAITSVQALGQNVAVPVVNASRCFGCGYCERFCPVAVPAIVILPLNAQRLAHPTFKQTGQEIGLNLVPTGARSHFEQAPPAELPEGALPPGFLE